VFWVLITGLRLEKTALDAQSMVRSG